MNLHKLPWTNLKRKPLRTTLLVVLVALLACIAFGSTVITTSLRNGLSSLEDRLGADVIVAPKTAKSLYDLEAIMVDGVPGYFYMDAAYLDKVAQRDGVAQISPQYYLASVKASCCSVPVQIIGIDPATDFTIQPWIARSYANELGYLDVVAGCNISGAPGSTIVFYGVECRIVAKLDKTGTALDNAVFTNVETIKRLIEGSAEQGMDVLQQNDPDSVISTIQIKTVDGFTPEKLADDINLHVRGVTAVESRAMTSGVADSITGVAQTIRILALVLCAIALVILFVAFFIVGRSRTKEFAVLRVLGASRKALLGIVTKEAVIVSIGGAIVGLVLASVAVFGFSTALESALGLPFLLPKSSTILIYAGIILAGTLIVGIVASALSASQLTRVDTGQILRED